MIPKSKLLAIIAGVIIVFSVSFVFVSPTDNTIQISDSGKKKAIIIDQLYADIPSLSFHEAATGHLERAGYQVDIITTDDITIDFYKNLPQKNYDFVIVRSHGAADSSDDSVVLFTGENYNEEEYISEQLFGHVKRATPFLEILYAIDESEDSRWNIVNSSYRELRIPANPIDNTSEEFFAISPKLVEENMNGKFHGTTFLLGGCNTASNPSMAHALINNGASQVVGWDDTIGSADNDRYLLMLLRSVFTDGHTVEDAVDKITSNYINQETMAYPATIKYFSNENI